MNVLSKRQREKEGQANEKKNGADQKMPGLKFGKNTPIMHQTLAAV